MNTETRGRMTPEQIGRWKAYCAREAQDGAEGLTWANEAGAAVAWASEVGAAVGGLHRQLTTGTPTAEDHADLESALRWVAGRDQRVHLLAPDRVEHQEIGVVDGLDLVRTKENPCELDEIRQ